MTSTVCSDCVSGATHTGTPTGTETTVHGLPTYAARPEGTPKGLIVFIPDGFGWKFVNNRLLADNYAKKGGYLVYVPEFMNGHAPPASLMDTVDLITAKSKSIFQQYLVKPFHLLHAAYHLIPFLIACRQSVSKPLVFDFFKALRSDPETSDMKIGAAGFCWGGQFVFLLAHDTPSSRVGSESGQLRSLIDVGFTAHPSGLSMPRDVENLVRPVSVAVGDVDMMWKIDSIKQAQKILEEKTAGDYEVVVYPGAKHGFAIRGDPSDPKQKVMGDQAEEQALKWFGKWLG